MAILIFAERVAVVSLGTLRTAFIVGEKRALAFVFGFVEVLAWVAVVAEVITNLGRPIYLVAFALGFASGTVVGISRDDKSQREKTYNDLWDVEVAVSYRVYLP
jgi:uncharacterized protein YebE (UPF0316 family)